MRWDGECVLWPSVTIGLLGREALKRSLNSAYQHGHQLLISEGPNVCMVGVCPFVRVCPGVVGLQL